MTEFDSALLNTMLDAATGVVDSGTFALMENDTDIFTFALAANSFASASSGIAFQANVASSTALATTSSGINRYQWRTSAAGVRVDRRNLAYTVAAANQSANNDSFTITSHLLETGMAVRVTGTMPTTTPQIYAGDILFVIDAGANAVQLATRKDGPAIAIGTAAGDDTFTITRWPPAIAALPSLAYTVTAANQSTGNNDFTVTAHGFNANDLIRVSGTLPTTTPQLIANGIYFAIDNGANSIQLSATEGGAAIDITAASGDNTFTMTRVSPAIIVIDKADLSATQGSTILAVPSQGISWAIAANS